MSNSCGMTSAMPFCVGKEVIVIDREAMHFLVGCEEDGVKLENCAPYIREWMEREKD
jgi:predicted metal-binding protein